MITTSVCPNCLFTAFSEEGRTRLGQGSQKLIIRYKCGECGCEFEDVMVIDQTNILKEGELPKIRYDEVKFKFGEMTANAYKEAFADFGIFMNPQKYAQKVLDSGEFSDAMRMLAGWASDNKKEMAKAFIRQLYQDFYA